MFRLFFGKKKTEIEKLQDRYEKLQEESFKLSHIDREASVKKAGEAEDILKKIEELSKKEA